MPDSDQASNGEPYAGITLRELSVVIAADQNNPSILNPDFLRHNEIVPADLVVRQSACLSSPMYSRVEFEGNLTVTAEPNRVIFAQTGQPLDEDTASRIPQMATCFVKALPHVTYRAIGINPKGVFVPESESSVDILNVLKERGRWTPYYDVPPEITLGALYRYQGKMIHLNISADNSEQHSGTASGGIQFQINFHHDVDEQVQRGRIDQMVSVLSDWKSNLGEFHTLVSKFASEITV